MKASEIVIEKIKESDSQYEHPGAAKLAELGRILMDKSIKIKDDKISNLMSRVGDELTRFGSAEGARNIKDLEKRCGCPYAIIEKFMKFAGKHKDTSLDKVKDPEPSNDDEMGDFDQ